MAMDLNAKAAYIRGMMKGMEFDPTTQEGKIIVAMMDLLEEMAAQVTEHDDAARAVADAARAGQRLYFEGFHRVCVFSDNGPAARDGAFAAKALFEETYPDVKVYVDYEIPYFIVSAGNCLTKEEAIMLKGRVSATFPKAFLKQLKREKSPISNLLDQ